MLKVAPCTVVRSYNQIFLAWWVTTILYSYGATLCELRYKYKRWWRFRRKATLFLEKREQPLFYPEAAGGICCIKIIFSWSFPHPPPQRCLTFLWPSSSSPIIGSQFPIVPPHTLLVTTDHDPFSVSSWVLSSMRGWIKRDLFFNCSPLWRCNPLKHNLISW